MSYKLYIGGYRHIQGVTVAVDDAEAEVKLRKQLSLGTLPCEFDEVDLKHYDIVLKDEQLKKEVAIDKPKKPPKK